MRFPSLTEENQSEAVNEEKNKCGMHFISLFSIIMPNFKYIIMQKVFLNT